jgi:hypothetical protein
MGKCNVKYTIEIEVKDVDRQDDIDIVGETLISDGMNGLSKDRTAKRLNCVAESTETINIPF